ASFSTASGSPVARFSVPAPSVAHVESFSAALTDADQSVFSWGGMVVSFDGSGSPFWGGPMFLGGGAMVVGWASDNGSGCENDASASPVILGDAGVVAYAGYDPSCGQVVGGLTALTRERGAEVWSYQFPPQPPPADPRYIDTFLGSLIVGYSS